VYGTGPCGVVEIPGALDAKTSDRRVTRVARVFHEIFRDAGQLAVPVPTSSIVLNEYGHVTKPR
jgi:hypothetical protein